MNSPLPSLSKPNSRCYIYDPTSHEEYEMEDSIKGGGRDQADHSKQVMPKDGLTKKQDSAHSKQVVPKDSITEKHDSRSTSTKGNKSTELNKSGSGRNQQTAKENANRSSLGKGGRQAASKMDADKSIIIKADDFIVLSDDSDKSNHKGHDRSRRRVRSSRSRSKSRGRSRDPKRPKVKDERVPRPIVKDERHPRGGSPSKSRNQPSPKPYIVDYRQLPCRSKSRDRNHRDNRRSSRSRSRSRRERHRHRGHSSMSRSRSRDMLVRGQKQASRSRSRSRDMLVRGRKRASRSRSRSRNRHTREDASHKQRHESVRKSDQDQHVRGASDGRGSGFLTEEDLNKRIDILRREINQHKMESTYGTRRSLSPQKYAPESVHHNYTLEKPPSRNDRHAFPMHLSSDNQPASESNPVASVARSRSRNRSHISVEQKHSRTRSPSLRNNQQEIRSSQTRSLRSMPRSPSLDLEWPTSPHQPSTSAGQSGPLSPCSQYFTTRALIDQSRSREFAVQQAQNIYRDVSGRVPRVLRYVPVERQTVRNVSRTKKMNGLVGSDWGQRSLDVFEVLLPLGKGSCGQVYKALDKEGNMIVALRAMSSDNDTDGFSLSAMHEIKLLSQLVHPNIVHLLEVVRDRSDCVNYNNPNGKYFISYDYAAHDLGGLLRANDVVFLPVHIAWILKQLLLAVAYCHQHNFVHCDIRPSNILVNAKGEVKLSNFMSSHTVETTSGNATEPTTQGTRLWYRAPELLLGSNVFARAVDMWSCGCILGELLRHKPLFPGADDLQQLMAISVMCGSPSTTVWPDVINLPRFYTIKTRPQYQRRLRSEFSESSLNVPEQAVDLLDGLLTLDPKRRMAAVTAVDCIWLRNANSSCQLSALLPTSRDCHSIRDGQPAAVGASNVELQSSGHRRQPVLDVSCVSHDQQKTTVGNADNKPVVNINTDKINVTPTALDAINKALGVILAASKKRQTVLASDAVAANTTQPAPSTLDPSSTRPERPPTQKKPFMKVIDHQNQPVNEQRPLGDAGQLAPTKQAMGRSAVDSLIDRDYRAARGQMLPGDERSHYATRGDTSLHTAAAGDAKYIPQTVASVPSNTYEIPAFDADRESAFGRRWEHGGLRDDGNAAGETTWGPPLSRRDDPRDPIMASKQLRSGADPRDLNIAGQLPRADPRDVDMDSRLPYSRGDPRDLNTRGRLPHPGEFGRFYRERYNDAAQRTDEYRRGDRESYHPPYSGDRYPSTNRDAGRWSEFDDRCGGGRQPEYMDDREDPRWLDRRGERYGGGGAQRLPNFADRAGWSDRGDIADRRQGDFGDRPGDRQEPGYVDARGAAGRQLEVRGAPDDARHPEFGDDRSVATSTATRSEPKKTGILKSRSEPFK